MLRKVAILSLIAPALAAKVFIGCFKEEAITSSLTKSVTSPAACDTLCRGYEYTFYTPVKNNAAVCQCSNIDPLGIKPINGESAIRDCGRFKAYTYGPDSWIISSVSSSASVTSTSTSTSTVNVLSKPTSTENNVNTKPTDTFQPETPIIPEETPVASRAWAAPLRRAADDDKYCPKTFTACAIPGTGSWECLDTKSELESCGGCVYGTFGGEGAVGVDCTALPGVKSTGVTCNVGVCVVTACRKGWSLVNGHCLPL